LGGSSGDAAIGQRGGDDGLAGIRHLQQRQAQRRPAAPESGTAIDGLQAAAEVPGALVFQAGTRVVDGRLLADGGRVLTICGVGKDLTSARSAAYAAVDRVVWDGGFCRRDIGGRL